MTSHHHKKQNSSSTLILSPDKNSKPPSPIPWLTSSSRVFSLVKIPPADPNFFSKTSMIQLGYGVWVNMTTLVTGLAIGFTTIALPKMQDEDSIITLSQESWIASVLTLCVPLGSLLGGILMDIYGRKPVLVFCCVPVSLGWFFIGLANTLSIFIIGCVIISIGLGMMLTAPRAYITEITLPNMRGVIGAMPYIFLSIGFVTAATLVDFIEWQIISCICGVYSIILMVFNSYLPETPHYVLLSSPDSAIESLRKFRSKSYDVDNEMDMLLEYRDENDIRRLSFRETTAKIFTSSVCIPFAISLAYILLMVCSGCIVVIMRIVEMLELSNTAIVPSTGNLIICLSKTVVGIMTSAVLYKVERKMTAIISAAGVGCSAIGTTIYLHTHVERQITPLYLYIAFISFAVMGYYTLPLLTMYEILPLQLRGFLSGINMTLMYLIIFGMNNAYPYARDKIGLPNLMAIFGGVSLLGTIALYYIQPETREVTLQEIEEYFGSKRPTLVPSRKIQSDQILSMMRVRSLSSTSTSTMISRNKSINNLNKIKSMKNKRNKDLGIVNEESLTYQKSERTNEGGSNDKTSEREIDEDNAKDKRLDISDRHMDMTVKNDEEPDDKKIQTKDAI